MRSWKAIIAAAAGSRRRTWTFATRLPPTAASVAPAWRRRYESGHAAPPLPRPDRLRVLAGRFPVLRGRRRSDRPGRLRTHGTACGDARGHDLAEHLRRRRPLGGRPGNRVHGGRVVSPPAGALA